MKNKMNELLENFSRHTAQNIDNVHNLPAINDNSNLGILETNDNIETTPFPYVPPINF